MKPDGCYLILVKRPDEVNWVLQTDSDGVVYSKAVDVLENCIGMYGRDQVVMAKRMYFTAEANVTIIGMEV